MLDIEVTHLRVQNEHLHKQLVGLVNYLIQKHGKDGRYTRDETTFAKMDLHEVQTCINVERNEVTYILVK